MKILVTGALGHIGSKLIRVLAQYDDIQLIALDNLSSQRYCSLFNLNSRNKIKFIHKSVMNISRDFLLAEKIDLVVHLAAITDAASSFSKKEELFENNLNSTKYLSTLLSQLEIPIIFASSTSVYGSASEVVNEDNIYINPQSPYAESKILEENALISAADNGLHFTILRFGTIVGFSPGMRFHTAVNKFFFQALTDEKLTVWRTALHQVRPYLGINDCIESILFAVKLHEEKMNKGIFNVVTINATVNEVIDEISKVLNKKVMMEFVEHEIMNQLSYEVSCNKIKTLGFEFHDNLQNLLKEKKVNFEGIIE